MSFSVYIIKCSSEVFYVGISKDASSRIRSHFNGYGSSVTRKYPPLKSYIIKENLTEEEAKKIEKKLVISMKNKGMNAFGAAYTQVK